MEQDTIIPKGLGIHVLINVVTNSFHIKNG